MLDSVPIVCITGQVSSKVLGTDAFQEVDITGITLPVTKHNYVVTRAEDVAPVIREAFLVAKSGRPGPCWLTSRKMRSSFGGVRFCGGGTKPHRPHPMLKTESASILQAAELIRNAKEAGDPGGARAAAVGPRMRRCERWRKGCGFRWRRRYWGWADFRRRIRCRWA